MTEARPESVLGPVIAVVGPSGVGKDSLMAALVAAEPRLSLMRRVITRAPEAGGEDYIPVSEVRFAEMRKQGAFALHWQAHGLHYGIPTSVTELRTDGRGVLVNFSRSVLVQAQAMFDCFIVLSVTATPEVLALRLRDRGRESEAEQSRRLAQAAKPLPEGLNRVYQIDNSGDLRSAVEAARALIYPERA